jgi:hypothetical protein
LCLRAYLDPSSVYVIPNAVDTTKLKPEPANAPDPEKCKLNRYQTPTPC